MVFQACVVAATSALVERRARREQRARPWLQNSVVSRPSTIKSSPSDNEVRCQTSQDVHLTRSGDDSESSEQIPECAAHPSPLSPAHSPTVLSSSEVERVAPEATVDVCATSAPAKVGCFTTMRLRADSLSRLVPSKLSCLRADDLDEGDAEKRRGAGSPHESAPVEAGSGCLPGTGGRCRSLLVLVAGVVSTRERKLKEKCRASLAQALPQRSTAAATVAAPALSAAVSLRALERAPVPVLASVSGSSAGTRRPLCPSLSGVWRLVCRRLLPSRVSAPPKELKPALKRPSAAPLGRTTKKKSVRFKDDAELATHAGDVYSGEEYDRTSEPCCSCGRHMEQVHEEGHKEGCPGAYEDPWSPPRKATWEKSQEQLRLQQEEQLAIAGGGAIKCS